MLLQQQAAQNEIDKRSMYILYTQDDSTWQESYKNHFLHKSRKRLCSVAPLRLFCQLTNANCEFALLCCLGFFH